MATLSGHSHDDHTGEHHGMHETTPSGNSSAPVVLPDTQRPGYWILGDHASFVATGENTGGQFSLFDFTTVPQGGPLVHTHYREGEFAYILDGAVSYQLHDQTFTANAGSFVYEPKGHPHAFANLGTTPARHLVFSFPSGLENLFAASGLPGPATSPPPPRPLEPGFLDRNTELLSQFGVDAQDSLIFAPFDYNVTKNGEPAVTLLRPGKADATIGVSIAMSDGTNVTKIPVNFADGERIKTLPIPLSDGGIGAGNKTINLTLTDPTGGAHIGSLQDKAVLTFGDNNNYTLTNGNTPGNLPQLLPNPQPKSLWLGGDNYSFIATGAETEGQLSLFDVFVPPQAKTQSLLSAPADEGYYVLDGNVTFQVGDQAFTANPNTFVFLPEGNSYALTNQGTAPARTLLFSTSSGIENFFSSMGTQGDRFHPPSTSIPEPSMTWGLLAVVALAVVSLLKNHKTSGGFR